MRRYIRPLFLSIFLFVMGGCAESPPSQETNPDHNYQATTELAKQTLNELQTPSFRNNREYCGYIGLDISGTLQATDATKGLPSQCTPDVPPPDWVLVASYHTHGAYDEYSDSEVPSSSDILADFEEGTNGYVSTPGGRLWFVDGRARTASLICGPRCVTQDPFYIPDTRVETSYTLEQLENR